jgi:hypothetical protein
VVVRTLRNLTIGAELFHTSTGIAYADLLIDGRRETWPLRIPVLSRLLAASVF